MTERFQAFSTDAEERWLTEGGERPPLPSDRLPPRAAVLIPSVHCGASVRALRSERVLVRDGALLHRHADTEDVLAPAAAVSRVLWLVDGAETRARLPVTPLGYVVLLAGDAPLLAWKVSDWVPGELYGSGAEVVRAAGFEAVARELGLALEVNPEVQTSAGPPAPWPDRSAGALSAQAFDRADVFDAGVPVLKPELEQARGLRWAMACMIVTAFTLFLCLLVVGLNPIVIAVLLIALVGLTVPNLVVVERSRRAVRELPELMAQWWAAGEPDPDASKVRGRPAGRGIGRQRGPITDDVVMADGTGWECWLPGPRAGGLASLVLARDPADDRPWGVLLLDRDEHPLLALPADRWLGRIDPEVALRAALELPGGPEAGLRLSTARLEPWPQDRLHLAAGTTLLPPATAWRTATGAGLALPICGVLFATRVQSAVGIAACAGAMMCAIALVLVAARRDPRRTGRD